MLPPAHLRVARIAPTPSGFLHAGNVANFLVNQRLAGPAGRLLLRIDDLDQDRYRIAYLKDVFTTLEWANIRWTDGPRNADEFLANHSQHHPDRMREYHRILAQLRQHSLVFSCACSRRELREGNHPHGCRRGAVDPDGEGVALRVDTRRLPAGRSPFRYRLTGRPISLDVHRAMPDFALRKRNGYPSYQLACTVDDFEMGVNVCARGRDLLASTAAQAVVSDLIGYPPLLDRVWFFHHPLLVGADGGKLSKSAGAAGVRGIAAGVERIRKLVEEWTLNLV